MRTIFAQPPTGELFTDSAAGVSHSTIGRRSSRSSRQSVPAILLTSDLVAMCVAIRLMTGHLSGVALTYVLATLALLAAAGAFRPRLSLRLSSEIPALLGAMALPLVALLLVVPQNRHLLEIVRAIPLAALLVIAGRIVSYTTLRWARTKHRVQERTLIVGTGPIAIDLAQAMSDHPVYGLVPVGFVDGYHDSELPYPLLGDVSDLAGVLRQYRIDTVIVAFGSNRDPELVRVIRACDNANTTVHVVPRFFELGAPAQCQNVDYLWGIPVLRLRRTALRSRSWRLKRLFDVVIVSVLLPLIAPVMGLIAVAVRATSRGPVFFRQTRVGQNGRLVTVLKFRSLHVNDSSDTTWSVTSDDRHTTVGKFLRKSSLDELPQLINVLKGEMSLVGPRPERPFFVSRFDDEIPNYSDRHRVPVGMTGWAQIHGLRGDTSLEERVRFDNDYIENWSLTGDLSILLRTFTAVIRDLLARTSVSHQSGQPAAQEHAR